MIVPTFTRAVAFLVGIASVATVGCASDARLVKQDELVKIYEQVPWLPHGYGDEILEFKGERYHHLTSVGYAAVPEKGVIMFVASPHTGQKYLYVIPIGAGEVVRIKVDEGTLVGIGSPDEGFAEHLERVDGDKVIFSRRIVDLSRKRATVRTVVDLKSHTVVEGEAEVTSNLSPNTAHNQSTDPTPASVTPVAGQPPRQP